MKKITNFYLYLLKVSVAVLLAAMVVLVFGNVVLRYVMNSGSTVAEELSRWIFVWMVFLGAIIGMKEHAHIRLEAIVSRLNPKLQYVCAVIGHVLMLIVTFLIIDGSWTQMLINANILSSSTGLPQSILYAAGVTFGVMAFLILLVELIQIFRGKMPYNASGPSTTTPFEETSREPTK